MSRGAPNWLRIKRQPVRFQPVRGGAATINRMVRFPHSAMLPFVATALATPAALGAPLDDDGHDLIPLGPRSRKALSWLGWTSRRQAAA